MAATWYTTIEALKDRLGDIPDSVDDGALYQVIGAASRTVDGLTGRTFYPETATRYVTPLSAGMVVVPELLTVTSVTTDEDGDGVYETTIAASAYDLEPPGGPYTVLRILPSESDAYFPVARRSVEITGEWGFASKTPPEVEEATLIIAQRLFMRKNAPMGLVGTMSEYGTRQVELPKNDPDVLRLLSAYLGPAVIV